jgi:UDP-N-acetylmuramoylalanine--D-glutamate ligase
MKIAILGYDTEGKVTYDYFAKQGHEITICDKNTDTQIPSGAQSVLGDNYLDDLNRFDLLVRTAGMPPHLIMDKNPDVEEKITTHINEFLKVCPTKNVIGVTGTKGKGTTSTLIAKMLEFAGNKVYLGGNIGLPPITFLDELDAESWVVLELSSFQLMDIKYSPPVAVCLMVVPEHLNWHADLAEYHHSKSNLFVHQKPEDKAIYFAGNDVSWQIAQSGEGQKIPYFESPGAYIDNDAVTINHQELCKTSELKLLGEHNWQNVCAAVTAVWQAGCQDIVAIRSVLTSFAGLPHRLEFVRELNGVKYYDDSFGTTPETAIVAMQAFTESKIVILGGSDKGASYDELARAVLSSNVGKALLIGDEASKIQAALEQAGFSDFAPGGNTMTEIIDHARLISEPGDVVLLSTGCASFGIFENYKDRGEQFKQAVQALA